MATEHEKLKQAALEAVTALIGDTSVDQRQTLEDLAEVQDLVDTQISAIHEELNR